MSTVNCPYCAEKILADAKKCKHCGEWVSNERSDITAIIDTFSSKYQIEQEVGRGGMAVVYKAIDKASQKVVALKVIPKEFTVDHEFVFRFQHEAKNCSKLNHSNIVRIFDHGEIGGFPYMVMELLEGQTLSQILKSRNKPFNNKDIRSILIPLLDGLQHAHDKGLIHRDIKSSNIMFDSKGRPVLMDFGISKNQTDTQKLTQVGTFIGTPEYSSPEQAETQAEIDHRSDIYSIGVVAYEMASLEVPFRGKNPLAVLNDIVRKRAPNIRVKNPNISRPMSEAIMRAMEKNKLERFSSCKEFKNQLEIVDHNARIGVQTSIEPQQEKSGIERFMASYNLDTSKLILVIAAVMIIIISFIYIALNLK